MGPLLALTLALTLQATPAKSHATTSQATPADAPEPAWQADLHRRHDELIQRNGPGTDATLRDQILALADQDQQARGIVDGAPRDSGKLQMATNLSEIDANLTTQMKAIITQHGWPTIALVGIKASNGAMLILTHSADHEWQRSLLTQLEGLADAGKIDGSALAMVIDKELVSEGKLQRYGTQFKNVDGELAMIGNEDPATLDDRRARVFLPPIGPYKQTLASMYHLKISNRIVSPTP
jgi:hypothetical protein